MSRDIEVRELTTLSVAADGSAFRMGLRDGQGQDKGLVFPSDALKALMMSLFRVGDTAFKRLFKDDSVRLVYPIANCSVQASPGSEQLILILRTEDGFEASFALDAKALQHIARQAREHVRLKSKVPDTIN